MAHTSCPQATSSLLACNSDVEFHQHNVAAWAISFGTFEKAPWSLDNSATHTYLTQHQVMLDVDPTSGILFLSDATHGVNTMFAHDNSRPDTMYSHWTVLIYMYSLFYSFLFSPALCYTSSEAKD